MKNMKYIMMVGLLGLVLTGCQEEGSSASAEPKGPATPLSLIEKVDGRTYDFIQAECTDLMPVPSGSVQAVVAEEAGTGVTYWTPGDNTVEEAEITGVEFSGGSGDNAGHAEDAKAVKISFRNDHVTLLNQKGESVKEGTWKGLDNNSVEVTFGGTNYYYDVEIKGSKFIYLPIEGACDTLQQAERTPDPIEGLSIGEGVQS